MPFCGRVCLQKSVISVANALMNCCMCAYVIQKPCICAHVCMCAWAVILVHASDFFVTVRMQTHLFLFFLLHGDMTFRDVSV
jgi:hypothetical protein